MAAKQRFALFLESAGPGDAAAQAVRRHGAVAVAAARAEFSGRILIGVSTRAEIVALIGEPDTSAGSAIATRWRRGPTIATSSTSTTRPAS